MSKIQDFVLVTYRINTGLIHTVKFDTMEEALECVDHHKMRGRWAMAQYVPLRSLFTNPDA